MKAVIRMIESNTHRHVGAPPASVGSFSILVCFLGFHSDRTSHQESYKGSNLSEVSDLF